MTTEDRKKRAREIIERGVVVSVLPEKEAFLERLAGDEPMRFYIGADPTSTALHLSHAKNYLLLEEFRQLGHEVIVLFGDFTARIGDPTDRLESRKQLTKEDVLHNVEQWVSQIKPLMDFEVETNPPKILFNGEWLEKLTMADVVELASKVTVQQMLERDMFEKRMEAGKPIHLHEFMYPLMQGYDSVAMGVDVELCGTDQTFNALMGRTLLKALSNKDKFVVTVNLMENPKTGELMSKSRGTGVFLDSTPFDMYGSIMSQSDEMTEILLVNNTRLSLEEVQSIVNAENPRDAKMRAAFEITKLFHGEEHAKKAEQSFISLVQNKEGAETVPEIVLEHSEYTVYELVRACMEEEVSNSHIRRLIAQNAVSIENKTIHDLEEVVVIPSEGFVLRVGKKRWFRVKN